MNENTNVFCFVNSFDSLEEAVKELMSASWSLAESDLDVIGKAGLTEEACEKIIARRDAALLGGHGHWSQNPDGSFYDLVRIERYRGGGEIFVFTTTGGKNQARFKATADGVTVVYRVETQHTAEESSAVESFTAAGWQRCDFIHKLFVREETMKARKGEEEFALEEVYAAFGGVDAPYLPYPSRYERYEEAYDGPSREHKGRGWH